jgi:hypothetical protein
MISAAYNLFPRNVIKFLDRSVLFILDDYLFYPYYMLQRMRKSDQCSVLTLRGLNLGHLKKLEELVSQEKRLVKMFSMSRFYLCF